MRRFIFARSLVAVLAGSLSTPSVAFADSISDETSEAREHRLILNALVGAIRQVEQDPKLKYNSVWKDKDGKIIAGIGITQVVPSNLKQWSQSCLGRVVTPEEYLGDVRAQLDLSYCMIGRLWDNYHDVRIVGSCWNSGRTDFNDDVPRDKLIPDMTVKKYVAKLLERIKEGGRPSLAEFTDWQSEKKSCHW